MIRLAVIGTNWITKQFVEAALQTDEFCLTAVYSRHESTAKQFGQQFGVTTYLTSLTELAQSQEIDAIYIASPNALHYSQIKYCLEHGKHVIGEKPLAANVSQVQQLIRIAKQHHVVLFEAFKTEWMPNFVALQAALPSIGRIRKAFLNYCQYSSRYPAYLRGENPNTFNLAFANGATMDIGFYCIAFAVSLWGEPRCIQANASKLASGVDGHGVAILDYETHDCTVMYSKVSQSYLPSEIQGEEGTILIEDLANCGRVSFIANSEEKQVISQVQQTNPLYYEANQFALLIKQQQIEHHSLNRTEITSKVMTMIRQQIGVKYDADNEFEFH